MGRQRPADHLPAHVLTTPGFISACAERDLGRILLLSKQLPGFSSSHLARRCELTVSRVQDYIAGRIRAQRAELFERVADGLHIPGALLDLAPRPWETVLDAPGRPRGQTGGDTDDGDPSVLRRDFLKLSAGMAAGSLSSGSNRVGGTTLEALRGNLARLRRLDDHLGGADTFPLYLAEVDRTTELLTSASVSGRVRSALQTLLAEQTQQAGWAAFDTGWNKRARDLFERSFHTAKDADSHDLAANALALRSYQLLSSGKHSADLTDRSLQIAAKSPHPAVKSMLYQRGAWTYAITGRPEKTAWALDRAAEAMSEPTREPAADWAAWAHDPLELEIMTGRCWAQLHRPMRAVPVLESALSRYEDSHARDKALYLSWLADAYLDAGEIEQAAVVTSHALDLSSLVASTRPQVRFAEVLQRFEPYAQVTGVSELLARGTLHPLQVRS